jgi:hypothetical protein
LYVVGLPSSFIIVSPDIFRQSTYVFDTVFEEEGDSVAFFSTPNFDASCEVPDPNVQVLIKLTKHHRYSRGL